MRFNKITILLLFASLLLSGAAGTLHAQNYWNVMNNKRIAQMSQFERVQYEKARKLLQDRQYRAAATEFDRFRIQYKESTVLPCIVFLCGYSYHCANDRFKAMGYYNEVVDFYPGETDVAAVALYYRGKAEFDNGNITKGMTTMKQLLEPEVYCAWKHCITTGSPLQLSTANHIAEAMKNWATASVESFPPAALSSAAGWG